MSLFFKDDIGNGFSTANGGQADRKTAFLSHAPKCGQCYDRISGKNFNTGAEAARDMYENGVRDPNEIGRRLGF